MSRVPSSSAGVSVLVSPTQARDEVEGRLRTAQESCEREEARAAERLEEVRTLYHVPSGQTAAISCAVDCPPPYPSLLYCSGIFSA